VGAGDAAPSRFNGFVAAGAEKVETVSLFPAHDSRLKPGANEKNSAARN